MRILLQLDSCTLEATATAETRPLTTSPQQTYTDEQLEATKQAALSRVDDHADSRWKEVALQCVYYAAQDLCEFTTDEVADRIPADVTTHELRALGPVMLAAVKAGYVKPTGKYRTSNKLTCHRRPKAIWASCFFS